MARKHQITLYAEFDEHDTPETKYIVVVDDYLPVATCRLYAIDNERVMLGLRTSDGISRDILYDQKAAEQLIRRGLLKEQEGRLIATQQGLHILNSIIETLMI